MTLPPQVERQKLQTEESSMRLSAAKGRLDRSLTTAEQELQEAQQHVLLLQVRSVAAPPRLQQLPHTSGGASCHRQEVTAPSHLQP